MMYLTKKYVRKRMVVAKTILKPLKSEVYGP